jgi:hypothetical protein
MSLVHSDAQRPTSRHLSAPASPGRQRRAAALRAAGVILPLLLALTTVPRSAAAQGGMGGGMGGMGGMGGGGGRGGGGRGGRGGKGGDSAGQRGPSSDDAAKQMEELSSLDRALRDVPDLDGQKKDSLKAIEGTYAKIFKSYGIAARNKVDSARAAGGLPDVNDMRTLRTEADSVRSGEFVAARALLTTDEQRARFDQNIADIHAEDAKREEQMKNRRGSGGMGGRGGGGGDRP